LGAAVVIAANAGGAWTPIGDVTTTMLWIHGYLTSWVIIKTLFLPSLFIKNAAIKIDIEALFDGAWELEQTGIEYLLAEETDIDAVRGFLEKASDWDDYPSNRKKPELYEYDEDLDDDDTRAVIKRVLKQRKGSGYAEKLVEMCSDEDLPEIISTALNAISEDLPNAMVGDDADDGDEATEDVDDDA